MIENSLSSRWLFERNFSRNSGDALARFVIEYLSEFDLANSFPLDLSYAIHDYSINENWIIGINFIQDNLKHFPKQFVFDSIIESPDHVPLLINYSFEEAIYIKKSKKLPDGEIVCDNHYLIFDGNDYTIKKYEISNWRLK